MPETKTKLHKNWEIKTLGEVADYLNGRAFKPTEWEMSGWPIIRIQNLNKPEAVPNYTSKTFENKYLVRNGDLLFAWSASLGAYIWRQQEAWLNQHIFRVDPKDGVDKLFLFYFLDAITKSLYAQTHGSGMVHVTKGKFEATPIPLPPLPEQKRIVAKIEELFTRLDAGVENLKKAQIQIKRYRQSVLKDAFTGKLTENWRNSQIQDPNSDLNKEPAEKLLERILAERRQKWEDAECARMKAKNKKPKNDKWKDKYKEPLAYTGEKLPIPKSWVIITPEELAAFEPYSLAIGPFGSNLKVSDYKNSGVPLIFVRNIRSKNFEDNAAKYVLKQKASELLPHMVNGGDILITKMGEPPGDACVYPRSRGEAIITADCIKIKITDILDTQEFFVHSIHSSVVKPQIANITKGVAQKKVSLGRFRQIGLPFPSLKEQHFISDEIERHFSIADSAEKAIETSLKQAERLRQSILKKAFEGKLVSEKIKVNSEKFEYPEFESEQEAMVAEERAEYSGSAEPQLGINKEPMEWYSRGYLPHRDRISLLQSVTFRLADSMPQEVLRKFEDELSNVPEEDHDLERRKKIEHWLDSGCGCCALQNPEMAQIMQETLLKFDGEKYRLIAWVIMPNHVHVLIEPFISLGKIVQSWKSFTGRWGINHNAELGLGVPGKEFWMREYWDRFIRDEDHLNSVINYIHNNPMKARLCKEIEEWVWSSAGK